jgi:hypothetical protein
VDRELLGLALRYMSGGRAVDPFDSAIPGAVPRLLDNALLQRMRVDLRRQIQLLVERKACRSTGNLMAKSPQ